MNSLKKKLGARIQKLRKSQKITQEKLAEMIDLDTPNLSNIECGRRFMTAETLEKIARALNVPESELFNFSLDYLKEDIIQKLNILSNKELNFIYNIISNVLELR